VGSERVFVPDKLIALKEALDNGDGSTVKKENEKNDSGKERNEDTLNITQKKN